MNSSHPDNFFHGVDSSHPVKEICITASVFIVSLAIPLICGIVWYVKFGSDRKSTVQNMLLSSGCFSLLKYALIVQTIDILRFSIGPLPSGLCFFQVILRNTVTTDLMLLSDFAAVINYLYVFHLKNPAVFPDDFWAKLITIWVQMFGIVYMLVWHTCAKRQPVGFYICAGKAPPVQDSSHSLFYGVLVLISIVLHITVFIFISREKRKTRVGPMTYQAFFKKLSLKEIEARSISNLLIPIFNLMGLLISINAIKFINNVEPVMLNSYPYNNCILFAYLVSPGLLTLISLSMLYGKHKRLRKVLWAEIKEAIDSKIH